VPASQEFAILLNEAFPRDFTFRGSPRPVIVADAGKILRVFLEFANTKPSRQIGVISGMPWGWVTVVAKPKRSHSSAVFNPRHFA
jgi:hypothetical protein